MPDAFFLEISKEKPAKCLIRGARQGEKWGKRPYFHRAVEMKQPHTITEPKTKALSYKRGYDLLKFCVLRILVYISIYTIYKIYNY